MECTDLLARLESWRAPFSIPVFDCTLPSNIQVFDPAPGPPTVFRYEPGRGIASGDRYAKQTKLHELYQKLLPTNQKLARALAEEAERELFTGSDSAGTYASNFLARFKSLSLQIEFMPILE